MCGCTEKQTAATRALVCVTCSRGDDRGRCLDRGGTDWCPLGKFRPGGLVAWPTVSGAMPEKARPLWYGSPMPLRIWFALTRGRWPRHQSGCGCLKPLKDWARSGRREMAR